MCLGEVGRVSDVGADGVVSVEVADRLVTVVATLIEPPPRAGDWVLVHSGFALSRLSEPEALAALGLRRRMAAGAMRR